MRLRALGIAALAVVMPATVLSALDLPGHLVVNSDLTAAVRTAAAAQQFSGRMNGYLTLCGDSLEKGAGIEALNVALFVADQETMTGKATLGKPTGVVGFSATTDSDKRQRLRYDAASRSLVAWSKGGSTCRSSPR